MKKRLSRRTARNASAWLLLGAGLFALSGCSRSSAARDPKPSARVIAEFRGGEIRESDLSRAEVFEAEQVSYRTKLARINDVAENNFLEREAKKNGISVEEFLKREVMPRVSVTNEEVEKEYLRFVASVKDNPGLRNLSELDLKQAHL